MTPAPSIPTQIEAIKDRYVDYWRSVEALKEAIAVWGAEGKVNDSGVFADCELETVAKSGRAGADIGICKVCDGVFVHCCCLSSATYGFGYAPSVWRSTPHETADEARLAAIAELVARIGDTSVEGSQAGREDLRQVKRILRHGVEQPSLF